MKLKLLFKLLSVVFLAVFSNSSKDFGSVFSAGMIHGFLSGLFLAMPIIGVNALFERKSFKYTLVNGGYWIISFIVMGGIICSMK